jgi:hypothetical protein
MQVEQMKKKSKAKTGPKKEEKAEPVADASKVEEPADVPTEPATPELDLEQETPEPKDASESNDAGETVAELNSADRQRQSSLSIQSKMRSSSFRQSIGGPLSPGYGLSPDGDTAPEIYRKQATRIEELERENKRLTKDVADGERRWKKAEEELEELREAEDDPTATKEPSTGAGASDEIEKLVLAA